jgi:hypothetical protein
MRLMNIHDQKLNGNLISKRRYIMELDNWEDIIHDHTILLGNSNIHNPIWGSLETKNSTYMIKLTEDLDLHIANNFQFTCNGTNRQ